MLKINFTYRYVVWGTYRIRTIIIAHARVGNCLAVLPTYPFYVPRIFAARKTVL